MPPRNSVCRVCLTYDVQPQAGVLSESKALVPLSQTNHIRRFFLASELASPTFCALFCVCPRAGVCGVREPWHRVGLGEHRGDAVRGVRDRPQDPRQRG